MRLKILAGASVGSVFIVLGRAELRHADMAKIKTPHSMHVVDLIGAVG